MTIVEKAAYLKGLADGLGFTAESKEGKLWAALNELLSDMAHEIEDLQSTQLDMADAVDELTDDLNMLEDYCCALDADEDDEDEEDEEDFDDELFEDEDDEAGDDEAGDDEAGDEDDEDLEYDGILYDVTCPVCGEEITLDEDMLAQGSIDCPHCGEALEFDTGDDEET